jgi:hypothetical protein
MDKTKNKDIKEKTIKNKIIIAHDDNNDFNKNSIINQLDNAIKEEKIIQVIIYFSRLCYLIDTEDLLALDFKSNFDIIKAKAFIIKNLFIEFNDKQKILNIILTKKSHIIPQLYLYIIIIQIILDNDNTQPDEISNLLKTLNHLISSFLYSYDNYSLIIFFIKI